MMGLGKVLDKSHGSSNSSTAPGKPIIGNITSIGLMCLTAKLKLKG